MTSCLSNKEDLAQLSQVKHTNTVQSNDKTDILQNRPKDGVINASLITFYGLIAFQTTKRAFDYLSSLNNVKY